ncbi:MAG: transcription-repair coupling factor [Nitrospirota bacterium]
MRSASIDIGLLLPVIERLNKKEAINVSGLLGSTKALFLSLLKEQMGRPICVLTSDQKRAEGLVQDISFFSADSNSAFLFPEREIMPYDGLEPAADIIGEQIRILYELNKGNNQKSACLILSLPALLTKVISGGLVVSSAISIKAGEAIKKGPQGIELTREDFIKGLVAIGYQPEDPVTEVGKFSIRGGIVDIYTPYLENPVRIDFFGDISETIKEFDIETQLSTTEMTEVVILPVEMPQDSGLNPICGFLPSDTVWVIDEPEDVKNEAKGYEKKIAEGFKEAKEHEGYAIEPSSLYISWDETWSIINPPESPHTPLWKRGDGGDFKGGMGEFSGGIIQLHSLSIKEEDRAAIAFHVKSIEGIGIRPPQRGRDVLAAKERGDDFFENMANKLKELKRENSIVLVCPTKERAERIQHIFSEYELELPVSDEGTIRIELGELSSGFSFTDIGLIVITEDEIFGRRIKHRPPRPQRLGQILSSFTELNEGDYVVHIQHGIGQFSGLKRLKVGEHESDFLQIKYAGSDRLYVPVDRLNVVQKYIGVEGKAPKIDSLKGTAWERAKAKVKRAAELIAKDLLELYAHREVAKGIAHPADDQLMEEFEAAFEYDETDDQLTAIVDVKRDMEKERPMDRLVCGDVGYGKTEVAMRAAFKAISCNKQIALLVPTTILAEQHYQTFKERFLPFPVNVEMLSRFRTSSEQKEIIRGIADGKIDIIIGTHRLLQKDVVFKDLGLVIIDEEHRFGVRHKERLKELRKNVDVLTLTATPIPRTLQMSMVGIRDMSIINTPPPDRLSIRSVVARFDGRLIREAILKELNRNGQVFFVHNRVRTIDQMAVFLKDLVPEARIAVAHGQMNERALEDIMVKFVDREYDILLSTTIIESGLDIPSANTIIINNADKFGLAELYQLRGRVGRSREQAHAYLLIAGSEAVSEIAKKRLQAITELTELGAGFRLAMRDLEIRGSGNLLGRQQSGDIAAVGFELYTSLIERTIRKMKGETVEEEIEPVINLPVSAFIPEEYISNSLQRLSMYKRLAAARNASELNNIKAEIIDRFGEAPEPVNNLLDIIELKAIAIANNITGIEAKGNGFEISFLKGKAINRDIVNSLIKKYGRSLRFTSEYAFSLSLPSPLRGEEKGEGRWKGLFNSIRIALQDVSNV